MNQMRAVEISETAYAFIVQRAELAGVSPSIWLTHWLENQCPLGLTGGRPKVENGEADSESIEQYFGSVSMPSAVGADNVQIDADIAREIANNHEVP